ncbi:replication protein P [Mannheimia indoligenes]|uniref:replication protein P n=1 Tax=Mannheimia indoligenes TaxID=3103145 RepID=UPI002FE69E75
MNLQNTAQNRPLVVANNPNGKLSGEIENLVDRIFDQLPASCPSIQYWTEKQIATAKQQWILGFAENGIRTVEQVRQGMKGLRAKTDDFVPSIGKFIQWCNTIDYHELGLPDLEQLLRRLNHFSSFGFTEIQDFQFRSNAEYLLLTDLQARKTKHNWGDETLRNQAEKALVAIAKRIMNGEQIPPPKPLIEEKKKVPIDPRIQRILDEKKRAGAMQ